MSKLTFDILSVSTDRVNMRIEAPVVTPLIVLDQRARLKTLRSIGLESLPEEFIEDIVEGNLGRFTDIDTRDVIEERGIFKMVEYEVIVNL